MSEGERLQVAVWLGGVAYALWRGPLAVRVVAASLLVGLLASLAFWGRNDPYVLKPYLVVADLLTLSACAWAAAATRATWALSALGFQVLSLLTFIAKGLDPSLLSWGYLTLAIIWGYGVLASVVAGAFQGGRP